MKKYEINGSCSITVGRRGACRVLVWKPDGKDSLENLGIEEG